MAKDNNAKLSSEDVLAQQAMMGVPNSLVGADIQAQLQAALLEKIQEERAEKERAKEIDKRRREGIAREWKRQDDIEKLKQKQCPHLKPNGTSALAVMWDSNNVFFGTCQSCGKEFKDNDIPAHLMPPAEAIGGPGVR